MCWYVYNFGGIPQEISAMVSIFTKIAVVKSLTSIEMDLKTHLLFQFLKILKIASY